VRLVIKARVDTFGAKRGSYLAFGSLTCDHWHPRQSAARRFYTREQVLQLLTWRGIRRSDVQIMRLVSRPEEEQP